MHYLYNVAVTKDGIKSVWNIRPMKKNVAIDFMRDVEKSGIANITDIDLVYVPDCQ